MRISISVIFELVDVAPLASCMSDEYSSLKLRSGTVDSKLLIRLSRTTISANDGRSFIWSFLLLPITKIIIESAIVVVVIIMKLIRSHRDIRTRSEKQEKQAREGEREKIRKCSTRTSNQERALEELEEASMCQVSIHEHKSEESVALD